MEFMSEPQFQYLKRYRQWDAFDMLGSEMNYLREIPAVAAFIA